MRAVHFGAGNIGRGFIGLLLHQSGYEINFVDIHDDLIDELNKKNDYRVILANEQKEEFLVQGFNGLNSKKNPESVVQAIATGDLITTAVGPSILPFIAPLIAEGLKKRKDIHGSSINIIACENMIGGSSQLKGFVMNHLNKEEQDWASEYVGFPNSAVDRIVPNQNNENKLDVFVEPFYEWVIDRTEIVGKQPALKDVLFVQNLQAYIERKLFTVNTGHAATAYLGYVNDFHTISEAIENDQIKQVVLGALKETGRLLISKYQFHEEKHFGYIEKIIGRFSNHHIVDHVIRVGRSPIRKLGQKDRLVAPALEYMAAFHQVPVHLVQVIAAALAFQTESDQESITLYERIKIKGVRKAYCDIAKLDPDHMLVEEVIKTYKTLYDTDEAYRLG
ncbi:mannitol-1-phosphate 5-dehydrogenase [Bacillus sp. 03113]|uniref:mannitol-1-phosphate 5-dehydrogenase n=1 Tax=Bacillus sp. 03113 TaxID=2578211 RepID=UPI001143FD94|nr:mannitol-1-phosphate 5-dehydrogenase [Bacillus sp. 03113]